LDRNYAVNKDSVLEFAIPLKLKAGKIATAGERYSGDTEWNGLIRCKKSGGAKRRALERIIKIKYDRNVVLKNYDAAELSVKRGIS